MKRYYNVRAVLVTVLCICCFVQDALSNTTDAQKESMQVVEAVPSSSGYKNLKRIADMFWSMWEEVNREHPLGPRSVRNAMTDILTSSEFWKTVQKKVKHYTDITHDKERARVKIKKCDMITNKLTDPYMPIDEFNLGLKELCDASFQFKSVLLEKILRMTTKIIETVNVSEYLDAVQNKADVVELKPNILSKAFKMIRMALNWAGKKEVKNKFMASKLNKFGSFMNKKSVKMPQMTSSNVNNDLTLAK